MRIFEANVVQGQVLANNGIVQSCPIIGQGGDSSGVFMISEKDLCYIPNTTPDLSQTIDLLVNSISATIEALNSISSGVLPENAGGAITSGSFASGIASGVEKLNKVIEGLNQLKGVLK